MAMRLPICLPLIVTFSTGRNSGESEVAIASSQGRSRPRLCKCALKSAGVFSDGMRVSFFGSLMFEEEIFLAVSFAPDKEGKFARVIIAPHGTFAVGDGLAFVNLIPSIRAMINRMQ